MSNGLETMIGMTNFVIVPLKDYLVPSKSAKRLTDYCSRHPDLSVVSGPFVAGGIVVRALIGHDEINDIDVFCTEPNQLYDSSAINIFVAKDPGSTGQAKVYYEVFGDEDQKVQVIPTALPKTPFNVLLAFDLVHCMIGTDGTNLLAHVDALDLIGKRIMRRSNTSEYAALLEARPQMANNEYRIHKYAKLGFTSETT